MVTADYYYPDGERPFDFFPIWGPKIVGMARIKPTTFDRSSQSLGHGLLSKSNQQVSLESR